MALRAPSLVTTLLGHTIAAAVFFLTFRTSLRAVWLPQFYLLLSLATVLLLVVPGLRKHSHRLVVLVVVMLLEIVLGIPSGNDLGVAAVLGTVFLFVAMMERKGGAEVALCVVFSVALPASHRPIVAWGTQVDGAQPLDAALLAAYFLFLTWLVGLVGSRGQKIRSQDAELLRIDRTVRALSEANLDFQELATRMQRETQGQERRRITR
ncbi:MAG TPA: hypothetical protein VL354_07125, partial [Spirochaetia bacterium]|nr:hypothetical protein [Spirochaetia bacterium]